MLNPLIYVAALFALAGMFVCYQAGYTNGGDTGYTAGAAMHGHYERTGVMPADWYTYRIQYNR